MTHLFTLSLFGGFQVTVDGRPVSDFRSDKVRALLAYLAVEADRPHRREVLATLLWPDQEQRMALMNLRQSLYRLRNAIGDKKASEPLLRITRTALQWNPITTNRLVDVITFISLLEASQRHLHSSIATCSECLSRYQQAVALYHGPLLTGFIIKESEPFQEWLRMRKNFFHQQVLLVLHDLSNAYEQNREYELAQQYAQQQITLEPWSEIAHQQLMRVLAKSGQRAAALAQYEVCGEILEQELGVKPDVKTTALYKEIREGVIQIYTDIIESAPRHTLPMPLTPFIGREVEFAQLEAHLKDDRVLTLLGPGGIGKSRLALELAMTQMEGFAHGAYLVSLAKVSSLDLLVSTIATALNFAFDRQEEPKQQLLDYLREKKLLLVMDNAEQLGQGTEFLLEILTAAPDVKMLVTTRRWLNLPSQWILQVKGFPLPDDQAVAHHNPAMQLFEQRAWEVGHLVSEADLPFVRRICRLVGGMPLAIELAASWVRLLSCEEIAHDMIPNTDFLMRTSSHRAFRADPHQPTLEPAFYQSWQHLSPSEKYVLRKLSVFMADFDQQAAEQVAGASLAILDSLSDKLFLRDSEFAPQKRYKMHEMIRQFTADKMAEVPQEVKDTRNRHSEYYARFLKQRTPLLQGHRQELVLGEINREIKNIRAAWLWAIQRGKINPIAKALEGLFHFYDLRSWFQEGFEAFQQASQLFAEQQPTDHTHLVWAQLLARQGWFTFHLGYQLEAKALLEQSLSILRDLSAQAEMLFSLNYLAMVCYHLAQYQYARQLAGECLKIAQTIGHTYYVAIASNTHGQIAYQLEQYNEAKQFYHQSLDVATEIGDRSTEAFSLTHLGQISYLLVEFDEAKELFERSLQIREKIKDQHGMASSYIYLGDTAHVEGDYREAQRLYAKSMSIFHDIGNQLGMTNVLIKQGQLAATQQREQAAALYFENALNLALKIGAVPQLLLIFTELVNLLSKGGELDWANELLGFVSSNPKSIELCQPVANRLLKWLTETVPRLMAFSTRG